MSLDPVFQDLLLQLAQVPPAADLAGMRQMAEANSARLPRRPVQLGPVRDLSIPGAVAPLPARLYTPAGAAPATGWPLTVYYHGGGFVAYSIESHDQLCRELCAASGAAVLSTEYRLAPEHPYPAPVDDAHAALRWAHAHAHELGADPNRLAVAGDSAGANLSVAVTLRARDEGGPPLAAQLLIYPAVDFVNSYPSRQENGSGYMLTEENMQFFASAYLQDPAHAAHPHVSALHAAQLHDLPPALVLTAEYDPLRDEGIAYAGALAAAGGRAEHRPGPGMIHGYANMTALTPVAAALIDDAGAWLGQELRRG
jgi:acetyl esterase